MATTPRANNNRRPQSSGTSQASGASRTSRAKKPTTIDLAASEVKETTSSGSQKGNDKNISAKDAAVKDSASKSSTTNAPSAGAQNKARHGSSDVRPTATSSTEADPKSKVAPSSAATLVGSANVSAKSEKSAAEKSGVKSGAGTTDNSNSSTSKPGKNKGSEGINSSAGPVKKASSGPRIGKLVLAGLIGAIVTLGGAATLQYTGIISNFAKTTPASPTIDLQPLQSRIAAIQSKLDNLSDAPAPSEELETITARIAALESAPSAIGTDGVIDLDGEMKKIRGELDNLHQSSNDITNRLEILANSDSVGINGAATQQISEAVAPLIEISGRNSTKLGELENQISTLSSRMDEDVNVRIDEFDEKLKNAATGQKLATSVAINALKAAIENGHPYSGAITSLETLSGSSEPLELLKSKASTGVSTNKKLLSEFQNIQSSVLLAATNGPDAGVGDRLMSSIMSLVTITPTEALPGDTPQAIISRIVSALKSDKLEEVDGQWQTLPEPARQISQPWARRLGEKIQAQHQLSTLIKSFQPTKPQSDS